MVSQRLESAIQLITITVLLEYASPGPSSRNRAHRFKYQSGTNLIDGQALGAPDSSMPTGSGNDRAIVESGMTSLRGRITTVALVVMVALNFYLVNQNRQLAATLLSEQGVRRSVTEVAAGRVAPR